MLSRRNSNGNHNDNASSPQKKKHVNITDQMVLLGFGLGAFYWLFEAFLNIFTAKTGLNPFQLLVMPDTNPSWSRLVVLCLFIIFGAHTQYLMNERKALAEKSQRDTATRERFRRLLSPDLAEMVVRGDLKVEKGGENRIATVMFADIRGFTKMSEHIEPSEMLGLLNEYFELIVEIVFRHEGTVDKFMGDEIMVIWGAPIAHDDDPARAIRAALEIQTSLVAFNKARTAQGMRCVELGIGINTGNIVAGYIGSSKTMSYSVIGDIVNVAHGICSSARGGQIVISQNTRAYVHDLFDVTLLDPINTKGKREATPVYEVSGNVQNHRDSVSAY